MFKSGTSSLSLLTRTARRNSQFSRYWRTKPSIFDLSVRQLRWSTDDRFNAGRIAMAKQFAVHAARKKRKIEQPDLFLPEGSNAELLEIEVATLLGLVSNVQKIEEDGAFKPMNEVKSINEGPSSIPLRQEIELEIVALSSTGDGLAVNEAQDHVFVVPYCVPGDRVVARPFTWQGSHTLSDFIKVVRPSPQRRAEPQCKYFARCSGCQLQMMAYEDQLEHKRQIVRQAYKHFSGLQAGQMPEVEPTMGSPLQYGYRTKLTPHFDRPRRYAKAGVEVDLDDVPAIGYNEKNSRRVVDIESCPIGTEILQEGMKLERKRVLENLSVYKRGATILLRESTEREYKSTKDLEGESKTVRDFDTYNPSIVTTYPDHVDRKTYIHEGNDLSSEYITVTAPADPTNPQKTPESRTYKFTNTAGSFFQNNNSILAPFTSWVYSKCIPSSPSSVPSIKYLLDAYCGSGLFALTLSPLFKSTLGIDVDDRGIRAARENARRNPVHISSNLPSQSSDSAIEIATEPATSKPANSSSHPVTNAGFITADATSLFLDVPYPPSQTLCIIDPPRKGCSREFLQQLRRFGPRRIIYVSCNVHSQARDVGVLVNGFGFGAGGASTSTSTSLSPNRAGMKESWGGRKSEEEEGMWKYEIETVRGFDFFPQTGHVEGVCILNRVEKRGNQVSGSSS